MLCRTAVEKWDANELNKSTLSYRDVCQYVYCTWLSSRLLDQVQQDSELSYWWNRYRTSMLWNILLSTQSQASFELLKTSSHILLDDIDTGDFLEESFEKAKKKKRH